MVWVKLDDHFDEHPKTISVSLQAIGLLSCALCFCNRNLTDGKIPGRVLRRYSEGENGIIDELLAAGFLEPDGENFEIHDFGDYQPLRADVLKAREATRQRVQKFRSKSNGVGNRVTNAFVTGPPVPVTPTGSSVSKGTSVVEVSKKPRLAVSSDEQLVYDRWRHVFAKSRSSYDTIIDKRLTPIRKALGWYSAAELCRALDAVHLEEPQWWVTHHEPSVLFRDQTRIDHFLDLASGQNGRPNSEVAKRLRAEAQMREIYARQRAADERRQREATQ